MARTAWEETLADGPIFAYRLADLDSTMVAAVGENGTHGNSTPASPILRSAGSRNYGLTANSASVGQAYDVGHYAHSVEFWANLNSTTTSLRYFMAWGATTATTPWVLRQSATTLTLMGYSASTSVAFSITTPALQVGRDYHVAICADPASGAWLYINGALAASRTTGYTGSSNAAYGITIGGSSSTSSTSAHADARIADVAVFNKVLSPERIAARYAAKDIASELSPSHASWGYIPI